MGFLSIENLIKIDNALFTMIWSKGGFLKQLEFTPRTYEGWRDKMILKCSIINNKQKNNIIRGITILREHTSSI